MIFDPIRAEAECRLSARTLVIGLQLKPTQNDPKHKKRSDNE